jgi:hypothetical protein
MIGAVSATIGLICLIAVALIWTIGGKHTPRLCVVLTITGVVGILGTYIGKKIAQGVSYASGGVGTITQHLTGTVVAGLLGLGLLYVVVIHVKNKNVTTMTLLAAAALPVAIVTIPGPIGNLAAGLISGLTGAVGTGISTALGIG